MARPVQAARRGSNEQLWSSVDALLAYQSTTGAFIASPDFSQYSYCWLRDASFVAYALDRAGEHPSSRRYHEWVHRAIGAAGIGPHIDLAIERRSAGLALVPQEMPPARFSLDGEVVADDWPNFQIDGYGTWLWSLSQHLELSGSDLDAEMRLTVARTGRYLSALAFEPCFDVWEENGDEVHTSTLGSVYAGLVAASCLLGDEELGERAADLRVRLREGARERRRYEKSNMQSDVDASLLWLGMPFALVEGDDAPFAETVRVIEAQLTMEGGIRRYPGDTYFGGGSWPVLTSSLGWHYATAGRLEEARRCLDWSRSRVDAEGRLAEQFGGEIRNSALYDEWVDRWGPPARDLLWSHAMYIVLGIEIEERSQS